MGISVAMLDCRIFAISSAGFHLPGWFTKE